MELHKRIHRLMEIQLESFVCPRINQHKTPAVALGVINIAENDWQCLLMICGPIMTVGQRPGAEYRLTNAHSCRAFFDSDFEIARHAH